jgi:imidazolonepropionase-like amidohydrolase
VSAIVTAARAHGLLVTVHLSGPAGAEIALEAGVDEWAYVPCDVLPDELIERAATAGVRIVGTLATQSRTPGVFANAARLAEAGIRLLYAPIWRTRTCPGE